MKGRVLTIGGSDSSGGAGIQADIKTISALGAYAASAITAVTAQNTKSVSGIYQLPADIVAAQIRAVLDDISVGAVKTGMLGTADIVEMVAREVSSLAEEIPIVVDPVMVSTSGTKLLDKTAHRALRKDLLPCAHVLTPNVPEAESLTGRAIVELNDMKLAAQKILSMGAQAVFLTGGHLTGAEVHDVLATASGIKVFTSPRLNTRHTHGTGCTLASAIATGLSHNIPLEAAVPAAREFVFEAIKAAPYLGEGHGPLNHLHRQET
jgi:hydroxymethylpyrimidine/phosphomethylpyrimidine kinase